MQIIAKSSELTGDLSLIQDLLKVDLSTAKETVKDLILTGAIKAVRTNSDGSKSEFDFSVS